MLRLDGVPLSSATSPGVSDTMLVFDLVLVVRLDGVTAFSSTGSTSLTVDFLVFLGTASGAGRLLGLNFKRFAREKWQFYQA